MCVHLAQLCARFQLIAQRRVLSARWLTALARHRHRSRAIRDAYHERVGQARRRVRAHARAHAHAQAQARAEAQARADAQARREAVERAVPSVPAPQQQQQQPVTATAMASGTLVEAVHVPHWSVYLSTCYRGTILAAIFSIAALFVAFALRDAPLYHRSS